MSPQKTGCLFAKSADQNHSRIRCRATTWVTFWKRFLALIYIFDYAKNRVTSCDGLTDDPPSRDHHQYIQSCLAQSSGISVTPTQIFTNVSKLEHSRLNTFDSFRITFKFIGFLGVWFIWFYRVNRRHIDRVRIRLMLISDWFIRVHAGLNQIINSRTGSFWDH